MEFSTLNGYKVKDKKAIRFYDTVESMKSDTTLKDGMHVKTKGYYSANDGGGCEYHITSTESESEYQETLENGLYASLLIKDYVSIKDVGCLENTDITEKLTELVSLYNKIYINEGTYTISEMIELGNDKEISGSVNSNLTGSSTVFKIGGNCYIHDLNFIGSGDRSNDGLIVLNEQNTHKTILNNLYIYFFKNGINNNGFDTIISNCTVSTCLEDGIYNHNTSPKISNCKLYNNRNGLRTIFGPLLMENCKMFINKQSGICIDNAHNCTITNCVTQQNGQYGIYLYGDNNQISNCHSYANNTEENGTYSTLFLRGNNNKVDMFSVPFYSYWDSAEKHILDIYNGNYEFNDINIKTDVTQGDMPADFTPVNYIDRITGSSNINIDILNIIKGGLLPSTYTVSGNVTIVNNNEKDYVLLKSNVATSTACKMNYPINDAIKYFGLQAFASRKQITDSKAWIRIEATYTNTSDTTSNVDLYYGSNDVLYNKIKSGKMLSMDSVRSRSDYASNLSLNVYLYTTGYQDTIAWKYESIITV